MTATTAPATVPLSVSGHDLPGYLHPLPATYPVRVAYVPPDANRVLVVPLEAI